MAALAALAAATFLEHLFGGIPALLLEVGEDATGQLVHNLTPVTVDVIIRYIFR